MEDLYSVYDSSTPPALMGLDYLGREVVLDGMESDFDATSLDTDSIQSTWDGVRDEVIAAGGQTEADAYDADIVDIRNACSTADTQAVQDYANVGLELVDAMEQLF
jgi:hypothetical protein